MCWGAEAIKRGGVGGDRAIQSVRRRKAPVTAGCPDSRLLVPVAGVVDGDAIPGQRLQRRSRELQNPAGSECGECFFERLLPTDSANCARLSRCRSAVVVPVDPRPRPSTVPARCGITVVPMPAAMRWRGSRFRSRNQ